MLSLTSRLIVLTFVSSVLSAPVEFTGDKVSALEKRQNTTTVKAPIIVKESQFWEGLDGEWSTFALRVGTPPQVARVIPATSSSEIWVIADLAACKADSGWASDCKDDRGGTFNSKDSSTWEMKGSFGLGLNDAIGYSPVGVEGAEDDFGQFGFDSVGFGLDPSSGPQRENIIVAEIVSNTWWGGLLGLSPEPVNYTEFGDPQASFTTKLKDEISSVAYSYTAGAKYKGKGVFGQLIYGGYDASRFEENDAIFTMTGDSLRDIVVTLKAIKATSGGTETQLLAAPEFVYIDSSIPEMVLPVTACEAFEKAFGIKHDEASGRYLMDETTHNSLKEKNPTINFTLANSKDSKRTVDVSLPYAAFDLQIQKPLYNGTGNSSAYFPLRRAPNPETYALGRAFLQEAYLTVDYNSRTFNLSQALFPDPLNPRILAVPPNLLQPNPNVEKTPGPTSGDPGTGGGLSTGALAGIIVAAVLGSLLLLTLIFFCCPCGFCPALTICGLAGGAARHRKKKSDPVEIDGKRVENEEKRTAYNQQANGGVMGVNGTPPAAGVQELGAEDAKVEIGGNPIMHPQEMPAELPPGLVTAAAARQSHELAAERPSADLDAGSSSGPNISSESRGGDAPYLSSGSEGISSVSDDSPAAGRSEVHGTGIRPFNGPADRLGRVDEIVSPVSPTQARSGWNGRALARPGNVRINTDEAQVPRVRGEPSTGVSPQTPHRWGDSSTD